MALMYCKAPKVDYPLISMRWTPQHNIAVIPVSPPHCVPQKLTHSEERYKNKDLGTPLGQVLCGLPGSSTFMFGGGEQTAPLAQPLL